MLQYKYATPVEKILIILAVALSAFTGIAGTLIAVTCGTVMNVIIKYISADKETEVETEVAGELLMDGINTFAFMICGLGIASFICTYLSTVLFNYTAANQLHRIRLLYLETILNQDIPWYDIHQTGDFASRMSTDLKKIEEGIGEKISLFVFFQSQFISSVIVAIFEGWELSLVCLLGFPVNIGSMTFITWVSSKMTRREMDAYGDAGAVAEETFTSIRTVLAFGGQQKEKERYDKFLRDAKDNNIKRSLFTALSNGLMWLLTYSGFALAFWYGTKLLIRDRQVPEEDAVYDPGNIMTIFCCVLTATYSFGMAAPYLEIISVARGAAEKIFSIIESVPTINTSKGNGKKLGQIQGNIMFKDVQFSYPSRSDIKVLRGFNLSIKAGETVALVGSSGCGKSTCIQLIQRFYDPDSGEIFVDNCNLKELDLSWLRTYIGLVGQEPVLFEATIADNIKLGCRSANQDAIEKAAMRANIHSFIKSLPEGYKTRVGERGAQLSGGQKQRIAIARALIRHPTILLLDEATSALDTNSESVVQAALDTASEECTTIIVAHRLSTVRKANRIVVISDGGVKEDGTHDELMAAKGSYYKLVKTQLLPEETNTLYRYSEDAPDIVQETNEPKLTVAKSASFSSEKKNPGKKSKKIDNSSSGLLWFLLKTNYAETFQLILGCLASIVAGTSIPAYSVIYGEIVGVFVEDDVGYIQSEVNKYATYFLILAVIIAIATVFQMHMFGISGEQLSMRLRSRMFEKMLTQEMGWFDHRDNGVGSLCAQLSGDTACVQGAAGSRIGFVLNALVTIVLALGISLYFEWRLSLIALCFAPLSVIALFLEQKLLLQESQGDYESLNRSSKIASEAIGNIRTVASLGSERVFYESYVLQLVPYYKTVKRNAFIRGLVHAVSRNFLFFSYCATFYYGAVLVRDVNLDVSLIIIVIECLLAGSWSIANATAFTPNFKKALVSADRIFKLMKRVPAIQNSSEGYIKQWAKSDIRYEKVQFSYPTRPTLSVLNGLNMEVPQDKMVALVGPSGCGKSTIVQLLERFYDPNHGKVSVDGKNIKTMNLRNLRSHLGIVSQEPNLFNQSIADNIAYGDNERIVNIGEIIDAAKKANIHNFITALPLGYDTSLGEKGAQLSGGQKQRVAIARALIRNPKVLLLDEATSALDAESEKIVQEALDNAKRGRTCISIAHRLSTIQDADIIYTINHGQIVESGTHSELMNKKGLYYNLYSSQGGST